MHKVPLAIIIFSSYSLFAMQETYDRKIFWQALIEAALAEEKIISEERSSIALQEQNYCSICDRTYHSPSYFNNHMAIHEGKSNHVCKYCQTPFTQAWNMKRHMSICRSKR